MTTALPINQQVNLNSLALETQDADLTGNLTVAGTAAFNGGISSYKVPIISNTASAGTTLTVAQSGSVITMSNLAGNTFTLPATAVGLTYTFIVGIVNTSNAYKVITPSSSFIIGNATINIPAVASFTGAENFAAVSTTTRSVNLNGTTTGGLTIGDTFTLTAVSATLWLISDASLTGSTAVATPFATS